MWSLMVCLAWLLVARSSFFHSSSEAVSIPVLSSIGSLCLTSQMRIPGCGSFSRNLRAMDATPYPSSTLTVSRGQCIFCPFMVLLFYRKISTSRIPLIYSVHTLLTPILTTIATSFYNNKQILLYLFILLF